MAVVCPGCKLRLKDHVKICPACGTPITNGYIPDQNLVEMFFKEDGRLNRLRYFKRCIVLLIIGMIARCISDDVGMVAEILLIIPGMFLDIRRLQDLDKDPILAYVSAVAIFLATEVFMDDMSLSAATDLGIFTNDLKIAVLLGLTHAIIGIYLLLVEGTVGKNRFGADPVEQSVIYQSPQQNSTQQNSTQENSLDIDLDINITSVDTQHEESDDDDEDFDIF